MNKTELKELFDQQAEGYNGQWEQMLPIAEGLYFFLNVVFKKLAPNPKILCVGAGTGQEIIYLANLFPDAQFTAVEPSGNMLAVCKHELKKAGVYAQCDFYHGYLETFNDTVTYDAATCFLVSHFLTNRLERIDLFRQIFERLKTGGVLVSSDLSFDTQADNYPDLLELWMQTLLKTNVTEDDISSIKEIYEKDVAIKSANEIRDIIEAAGFEGVVKFYQAGLISAFRSHKTK